MPNVKNETKTGPPRTSDADPSPERIVEGRSGLARLTEAMKVILSVPNLRSFADPEGIPEGVTKAGSVGEEPGVGTP